MRKKFVKRFNLEDEPSEQPVNSLIQSVDSVPDYMPLAQGFGNALYSVFAHLYSQHQDIHPMDFLASEFFLDHTNQVVSYFVNEAAKQFPQLTRVEIQLWASHIAEAVLESVVDDITLINEPPMWVQIASEAASTYYTTHFSSMLHSARLCIHLLKIASKMDSRGLYELADSHVERAKIVLAGDWDEMNDPLPHFERAEEYSHKDDNTYEPLHPHDRILQMEGYGMAYPRSYAPYDGRLEAYKRGEDAKGLQTLHQDERPNDMGPYIQARFADGINTEIVKKFGTPEEIERRKKVQERIRAYRETPEGQYEYYERKLNQASNKEADWAKWAQEYNTHPKHRHNHTMRQYATMKLNEAIKERELHTGTLKQLREQYPQLIDTRNNSIGTYYSFMNGIEDSYRELQKIYMRIARMRGKLRDPDLADMIDATKNEIQGLEMQFTSSSHVMLTEMNKFKDFCVRNSMSNYDLISELYASYPSFFEKLSAWNPGVFKII